MSNLNPRQKAENFYMVADKATIAKIEAVLLYFSIYFKIINKVRGERRLVYLDLFCGKGFFEDGTISVPIKLLEQLRRDKIDNITIIFNDIYFGKELEENINMYDPYLLDSFSDIKFLQEDSRKFNVSRVVNENDIVVSYIDSFSYIRVDSDTVYKLIKNYFSDAIFFLNIQHFFQRLDIDKDNLTEFFGGLINYNYVKSIRDDVTLSREKRTDLIIKFYISQVKDKKFNELYVLPLFFRKSSEITNVYNVIFIMSKNMKGINCIRNSLNNNDKFCINDSRFFVEEKVYSPENQICFFDFGDDYLRTFIPTDVYITRQKLQDIIDNDSILKYGYVSAINEKYLNNKLTNFEEKGIIEIEYDGANRRKNTFGEKTSFRLRG
jgi:three-Cys-motif partner protein